jgi:hypothetical protein
LSAYSLAKRVRGEFEEAVRLGPRNPEALADLGEYYKEAPEVIGGGTGKAEALVAQLDQLDPARAHQLRASIAEKRKDYGTAERELKQSIAASAHPAQPWIEMAGFLGRRARWTEMERAVETGANLAARDAHPSAALLDGASLLLRFHRNQILAAKMLEAYLAGNAKSEEAPAFVAHLRLAQVKDDLGDPAGAGKERAAALAMAHEYKPAQKAKH